MRWCLVIFALVFTSFASEAVRPVVHVNNFAMVNNHLLRGAEPSSEAMGELGAAGVKFIIDLREAGPATDSEKQQASKLGIDYVNVPLRPLATPTPDQIRSVLNLIAENDSRMVFVHCRRGKDRTGTVIACYRIQHDGWGNDRALNEAKSLGMSPLERGMRAFILHFTPTSNTSDPSLLTH